MPSGDSDISWQSLRRIVHEWQGTSAELAEVKRLVGGCINTTLLVETRDGAKAVLKISPHRVNRDYQREAFQLNLLRELGLPAPRVYASRVASLDDPDSFILMEHLDGVNLQQAKEQCSPEQFDHLQQHLAELMVTMHEHTSSHYCRVNQEPQNKTFDTWPKFYRHVYDQIWHEAEKKNLLPVKCRKTIAKLHERLERYVAHTDKPRLVHWDVWNTNLLARPDEHGRWWVTGILDPNCKFAHAEAEIAYMDLFHTCTPAFTRAYQQTFRLGDDYHRLRKPVYQLYPLINHVHLFGEQYVRPLLAAVDKVAALV